MLHDVFQQNILLWMIASFDENDIFDTRSPSNDILVEFFLFLYMLLYNSSS